MKLQTAFRLDSEILSKLKDKAKDGRPMAWHVEKALGEYLSISVKPKAKKARFDPVKHGANYPTLHKKAWDKWCEKRKDMKKPISKTAANQQIDMLTCYSMDEQRLIIWNSIKNDYQGLFEPKRMGESRRESLTERAERRANEAIAAIENADHALAKNDNALRLQVVKR